MFDGSVRGTAREPVVSSDLNPFPWLSDPFLKIDAVRHCWLSDEQSPKHERWKQEQAEAPHCNLYVPRAPSSSCADGDNLDELLLRSQTWGKPDRGIQLFGSAREVRGENARQAETLYAKGFPDFADADLSAYHFYFFRPRRLKLFDERTLGAGTFVTARIARDRRLAWERTEIYRSGT